MKKNSARIAIVTAVIFGFCLLCSNPSESNMISLCILAIVFSACSFASYLFTRNMSDNEMKDLFGVSKIEKKFGVSFTEE